MLNRTDNCHIHLRRYARTQPGKPIALDGDASTTVQKSVAFRSEMRVCPRSVKGLQCGKQDLNLHGIATTRPST